MNVNLRNKIFFHIMYCWAMRHTHAGSHPGWGFRSAWKDQPFTETVKISRIIIVNADEVL